MTKFIETFIVIFVSAFLVSTINANVNPDPQAISLVRVTGSHNQTRSTIVSYERSKPTYDGSLMGALFINAHNLIRKAKNVLPLVWDQTLESYSRKWAEQLINNCQLIHSPNSPYGENLFWSEKGHWTPTDVVKVWADEAAYYNPHMNECVNNTVCGHYTQIVWSTTQRLGCGRVVCNNNKGFIYVCSYDPPGNYYYEGPFGGTFNKSIVYPPSAQSNTSTPSQSKENQPITSTSTQSNKSASAQTNTSASTQSNKSGSTQSSTFASTQTNKSASASTQSYKSASTQTNTSASTQTNTSASTQSKKSGSTQSNKSASTQTNASGSTQSNKSASTQTNKSGSTQSNKSGSTQSNKPASTQSNKFGSTQSKTSASTQSTKSTFTHSNKSASTQPTTH